jgi:hypothetical protein
MIHMEPRPPPPIEFTPLNTSAPASFRVSKNWNERGLGDTEVRGLDPEERRRNLGEVGEDDVGTDEVNGLTGECRGKEGRGIGGKGGWGTAGKGLLTAVDLPRVGTGRGFARVCDLGTLGLLGVLGGAGRLRRGCGRGFLAVFVVVDKTACGSQSNDGLKSCGIERVSEKGVPCGEWGDK